MTSLEIVFIGLSVTSSWGNGHATNYRALMRALEEQGHRVTFLERDMPWYAEQRDLPDPPWGETFLYDSVTELRRNHLGRIRAADVVIVGSYVPEGAQVGELVCDEATGVKAFYDIDTPVTLAKLEAGDREYLARDLVPRYDLYLSFTGGPTLERIEKTYGAPRAEAFYCVVDPDLHFPEEAEVRWDLGYLGTYSDDRQPAVDELLVRVAGSTPRRRFVVAGPQYPPSILWPSNVERIEHLPPERHRRFYNAQRFTLNVTRAEMVRAGYSPSVRLFEAAACGVPVISDWWTGIDDVFVIGSEILVAKSADQVKAYLEDVGEEERCAIGNRARERVLKSHTAEKRARRLVALVLNDPLGTRQAV
ncbi:MAG TPA: glycosyltransferase [Actinomycetota bacterium]|nr:glycosyltransferase [Actinomycetota bacterium]